MMIRLVSFVTLFVLMAGVSQAQPDRWQQRVEYTMDVRMDVNTNRYTGTQKLVYYNNSPDTLTHVFYHLHYNAFQPGSIMDVRSQNLPDPDRRVGDRISKLTPDEIGYMKVMSLKHDGRTQSHVTEGTVLEVKLDKPIPPHSSTVFEMEFEAQVPLQVRRAGRDSAEGIRYSMSQWYPKMANYDYMGWHPNPYVAREFYPIFGDFEIKLTIDSSYVVAGTGYLQNGQQIGHGYEDKSKPVNRPNTKELTWHFKASDIPDFMWAADPDYVHVTHQMDNGLLLRFFYQPGDQTSNWKNLPEATAKAFEIMNRRFGEYPYKEYSVVQGGDGGMEYPMATLITGHRPFGSLLGVTVHELVHSWYQCVLATNESLVAWMDEGFTSYASAIVMNEINGPEGADIHGGSYRSYFGVVRSGREEALITHADHFSTNSAYSAAAYGKGAVFLHQLGYVIGQETLERGMLRYYNTWKFKHPNANDFIRIMEKESGMVLDWYIEYFVNSTHTIDYGIQSVQADGNRTKVTLERVNKMIMPVDLEVEYTDGRIEHFYMPLDLMRGEKPVENPNVKRTLLPDWTWVNPTYTVMIDAPQSSIKRIEIDPSRRMADIERSNNIYPAPVETNE
jgi:hypothetical protein